MQIALTRTGALLACALTSTSALGAGRPMTIQDLLDRGARLRSAALA